MDDGAPLLPPHPPSASVRPLAEAAAFEGVTPLPATHPSIPRRHSASRSRLQEAMLDPHRMIRWVYLGRFSVATAIFLAAQLVWSSAPTTDTRIASLIFAVTMVFTVGSAAYTEVYRAPLGRTFLYLQTTFDLLLVTAVVHLTGGGASQFALFYILVIASAALLLPIGGGLLVALLGIVCYFAEVLWLSDAAPDIGVWLQLLVFGTVALVCGYISARLQETGAGTAAELVFVRLQAEDISAQHPQRHHHDRYQRCVALRQPSGQRAPRRSIRRSHGYARSGPYRRGLCCHRTGPGSRGDGAGAHDTR